MDLHLPTPAGELTRAEQKILDYINTNTDAFLFSSIGQLAQQLELSDATVSRFARHVGCRDFKALKSLVLEQSPGPAVKLTATLSQGDHFSPKPGWSDSGHTWRRPYNSSPPGNLTGRWRLSVLPGGCFSMGKTPPLPWHSCSISACGGWAYRCLSFPPAVLNCWKDSRKRRRTIWWCCSVSPSSPGRAASSWSTAGPPAIGPWPLWAAPASRRRSGRTSASLPTGGQRRSITLW